MTRSWLGRIKDNRRRLRKVDSFNKQDRRDYRLMADSTREFDEGHRCYRLLLLQDVMEPKLTWCSNWNRQRGTTCQKPLQ